jgi:acetoin utilization deacetylase AcuC-like enzyme
MPKTAVLFSPEYYKHNPGGDHPESARRLNAIHCCQISDDDIPTSSQSVKYRGEHTIKEVKRVQKSFWSLD